MTLAISLIAAMAENRTLGAGNRLLWHIPEDFRHFKTLTMGKPVIMGRKTQESIGKPLPGRPNIVVTRNKGWSATGVTTAATLEDAFKMAENMGFTEVMVIGGAEIYAQALPFATSVYLTHIHKVYTGDVFFPALDPKVWQEKDRKKGADCAAAGMDYEFITYQRIPT